MTIDNNLVTAVTVNYDKHSLWQQTGNNEYNRLFSRGLARKLKEIYPRATIHIEHAFTLCVYVEYKEDSQHAIISLEEDVIDLVTVYWNSQEWCHAA